LKSCSTVATSSSPELSISSPMLPLLAIVSRRCGQHVCLFFLPSAPFLVPLTEGLALLLPAAPYITWAARTHVCTLEFSSEDYTKDVPAIDGVPRQVVQPGPSRFSQIDWKELHNEEIAVRTPRPTWEAVVLQLDAGVCFAVVLDNVTQCSEIPKKMGVAQSASKRLWDRPFKTEVASYMIVVAPGTWVSRSLLGLCTIVPWAMLSLCLRF
jgi:hypothetical protein